MHAKLLQALAKARVVGILRTDSSQTAVAATNAAVRAGLKAIELTFTTPNVEIALAELRQSLPEDIVLGVGTVLNRVQAALALEAGAAFLVSPHFAPDVLEYATSKQALYIPGVLTPSEMMQASAQGAQALKFFPAESSGGSKYIKDILSPFPELRIMATGGILPEQTQSYLEAGAMAVGLGSQLFPKAAIATADWQAVEIATRIALKQTGIYTPITPEATNA